MTTDTMMAGAVLDAPKMDMISIGRALLNEKESKLVELVDQPMTAEVMAQIRDCRQDADKLKRVLALSPELAKIKTIEEVFCALAEERAAADFLMALHGLNPPDFRLPDGGLSLSGLRDHFATVKPPAQAPGLPAFGQYLSDQGGHFAGGICLDGKRYGVVVANKGGGEKRGRLLTGLKHLRHEAYSDHDGLANTEAMAKSGGKLARWARGLTLNGFTDWYLPARDELELLYRHFKPTAHLNTIVFGRCNDHDSGENMNCIPLNSGRYTRNNPEQTIFRSFTGGGSEAFSIDYYGSSTLHREYGRQWCQCFAHGQQVVDLDGGIMPFRAVRRFLIEQDPT